MESCHDYGRKKSSDHEHVVTLRQCTPRRFFGAHKSLGTLLICDRACRGLATEARLYCNSFVWLLHSYYMGPH